MDHEPQRACDEIPGRRLAYHVPPRDHFVGTLSALVSSVFSYVASGADAPWRLALSSPGEPTEIHEFSVVRWQPWPSIQNQVDKDATMPIQIERQPNDIYVLRMSGTLKRSEFAAEQTALARSIDVGSKPRPARHS
jgi:hypothetical protein